MKGHELSQMEIVTSRWQQQVILSLEEGHDGPQFFMMAMTVEIVTFILQSWRGILLLLLFE